VRNLVQIFELDNGLVRNNDTGEITVFGRRNKGGLHVPTHPWGRDVTGIHTLSTPVFGKKTDTITIPADTEIVNNWEVPGAAWRIHALTNTPSLGRSGANLTVPENSLYLMRATAIEEARSLVLLGELPVHAVINTELFEQATVVDLPTFVEQLKS